MVLLSENVLKDHLKNIMLMSISVEFFVLNLPDFDSCFLDNKYHIRYMVSE